MSQFELEVKGHMAIFHVHSITSKLYNLLQI